ncbi:hypothetical protein KC19_VG237400 [Ceratodon purpureus]|uniref:Uncharacterized protein n=1 Tax=Ceratodon purpureus TaxID=3225 RepID=A0A8T0HSY2_CERPU|nr:hypothetical protein KC19_VG237400 [Ceratodon purpureus]
MSKVGWDANQVQNTAIDVVSKISCHGFQPYSCQDLIHNSKFRMFSRQDGNKHLLEDGKKLYSKNL